MRIIMAATLLLAGACAGEDTANEAAASPEEAKKAAAPVQLFALDCGRIDMLDLGLFDAGGAYDGRQNKAGDACFLIRHPDGDLLWDTGLPDALYDQEGGVTNGAFHVAMPKTLAGQLAEIDVAPADIEYLSVSHSHFDHMGNAGAYASSTFLVHEKEREHMFRDDARNSAETFPAYAALETAETKTFTGDYDVFGDGSVTIISSPGHTPGHTVLLVNLVEAGPVLLSGDLYHLEEAREKRTIPVFNTSAEETLASMDAFEALAVETGARVVIQHSLADLEALPAFPAYLD